MNTYDKYYSLQGYHFNYSEEEWEVIHAIRSESEHIRKFDIPLASASGDAGSVTAWGVPIVDGAYLKHDLSATVYIVVTNAPGCLPDSDPELITLDEDEANECFESLADELRDDFYVADLLEVTVEEYSQRNAGAS